jgi:aspartyl-tRNA(Asn)/glutamyl-tRNA(Gln) amidotransferase subunit A
MRMKWRSSSGRSVATDPPVLTAAAASRAIDAGTITAHELVAQCLVRIEAHDHQLNSFTAVLGERALAAAKRADQEIKAGRRRGPLHGIPLALKDIYATAGIATTANSRLLQDHVPESDSEVARRLDKAGAILIGKLNTHEFATGGPSLDLPYPPPRNPWSLDHFTGGSSSGSAAAVAAGLIPLAMGSDTLGSIRGPASYCGIAGFKPTYGVVSRRGVVPLSNSFDNCGPMAWTVEDCALLMDAIAGHDPGDPASAEWTYPRLSASVGGDIAGVRIGVARDFFETDMECDPETRQAIEDGLRVLEELGAKLTPVTLPAYQDWDACSRIIIYAEAYAIHERDLLSPAFFPARS